MHVPLPGVTGGLAAPLGAAGASAVLGAGGAAALGSATGIAIMASLFGAAGAGLTGERVGWQVTVCKKSLEFWLVTTYTILFLISSDLFTLPLLFNLYFIFICCLSRLQDE